MSLAAIVAEAGDVLGRGHSLFGTPASAGDSTAATGLGRATDLVRDGVSRTSLLSGEFAASYGQFGGRAGLSLDRLTRVDERLGGGLRDAATANRSGHTRSGTVMAGAAADVTGLAPYSGHPAGEKAMLTALRARIAQQQQVVAAYKLRDARMAALLRALVYSARATGSVANGLSSNGFSGLSAGGGGGAPGVSAAPLGSGPSPRVSAPATGSGGDVVLAAGADERAGAVPAGPGGQAVQAALSKRGVAYVWGAKGPNNFDCSGLTQWAWAQAGVRLGPDTYTQVGQGVAVPPGEVRAGDLVFPRSSWDGRGPGHVQLAISPTQVVHAPQTGDVVRIAPMPPSYVARRPVPVAAAATEN
ncbi:C40 family peptidase [Mycolicibacterium sp. BiH015]|uniref:C40 family peptidase n=1 Tax=Mycolicibacterium sp. BiH015 TaxID=3018808 RepID=UPI0022E8B939|nr:C40 family peptidase [Mycolicibacterium sp. BiH015]MDA2893419.1 C40 family peptidase [Mycolicibacterium sp. BiH015]